MSEGIRRLSCRVLFLVCCLLPTGIVAYWIVFPTTIRDWEQVLEAQLGGRTRIGSIETPTPYATVFHQLVVSDPGGQHQLVIPTMTVSQTDRGPFALIDSVEANAEDLSRLVTHIAQRVIQAPAGRSAHLRLQQARIFRGGCEQVFHEVKIDVQSSSSGAVVWVQAHPGRSGAQGAEPLSFSLRQQWADPACRAISLDTGGWELPCWLVQSVLPSCQVLGAECQFAGKLVVELTPQGEAARFSGSFYPVDLQRLVQQPFAQRLSGAAQLQIRSGELIAGRLTNLQGVFRCPQGTIGAPLLESLSQSLALSASEGMEEGNEIEFRAAVFAFQLRDGRLYLDGDAAGVLATDLHDRPLLVASNGRAHAVTSLVAALAQRHASGSVLTAQTAELLGYLPLPSTGGMPHTTRLAQDPDQTAPLR